MCFQRDVLFEPLEARTLLSAPIKIMPLGDSITEAFAPYDSYRYWLWNDLQNGGYKNVDFVGSMRGVDAGSPADGNFDQDHEGHTGWRADQFLGSLFTWASISKPDVVMMHLGTNDLIQGQSVDSTITDLGKIIDLLREVNPKVTVLLCQIIPNTDDGNASEQLNAVIPTLAKHKQNPTSRIVVVDQQAGFDDASDTFDGIHPNALGEQKMAGQFYAALTGVLPAPSLSNVPPAKSKSTYLSDLAWVSSENGFGPVELDQSNGGSNIDDGQTMSIDGTTYDHGLGVNATSRVDFRLNGRQTYFASDLGIDDETAGQGSVVFKVYADGKRIFCSTIIKGDDPLQSIMLNIKGVRHLTLIVNDAADGSTADHADWANARLIV